MNFKRILLTALLIPTLAFANPIDRVTRDLDCQRSMDQTWKKGFALGIPAYLDPSTRRIRGKVDQTVIFLNRMNKLQRVVFAVDTHLPGEGTDYKQSSRIWKTFNRKYGDPVTSRGARIVASPVWFWPLDSGKSLFMFTTGIGTAIMVDCPH